MYVVELVVVIVVVILYQWHTKSTNNVSSLIGTSYFEVHIYDNIHNLRYHVNFGSPQHTVIGNTGPKNSGHEFEWPQVATILIEDDKYTELVRQPRTEVAYANIL